MKVWYHKALTTFHELTNFGDVVGIGLGAVLIVFSGDKQRNLYACITGNTSAALPDSQGLQILTSGDIIHSQRIVVRVTAGQVLAPFNMDYVLCALCAEKRYEDVVSGFNWARHFCDEWFEISGFTCARGRRKS